EPIAAQHPAEPAEQRAGADQQSPRLQNVAKNEKSTAQSGRSLVAVFLLEPSRRPVVLRRIAAARTVQRGDVLERDEDVPIQLDVSHFLDVAVGGQNALLVLAAEERDLDLLAFVLVGV